MLTKNQKQEYNKNGFVAPLNFLPENMINDFLSELEYAQQKWPDMLKGTGRNNPHLVFPSLDKIIHDSRMLDAVESIIGNNILITGSTFFIKEPQNEGFVSWHQDAKYIGLEPHNWLTAWIAITDANIENGCMRMVPKSHLSELVHHEDTFGDNNLLSRGQNIPNIKESDSVAIELNAGQMSLHHPRTIHGSGPNLSNKRRIGFAVQSYIGTNVDQLIGKMWAQKARGEDTYKYHEPAPRPKSLFNQEAVDFWVKTNEELGKIYYNDSNKKRNL